MSRTILYAVVATVIVSAIVYLILPAKPEPPRVSRQPRPTLARAQAAFDVGSFGTARDTCEALLEKDRGNEKALMLLAAAYTKLESFESALRTYALVPDQSTDAATARWAAGEIYFHLGEASEALANLKAALELNPGFVPAHQRISKLYSAFGCRYASYEHLVATVKSGKFTPQELLLVGHPAKSLKVDAEVARYLEADPDDLLPTLGNIVTLNRNEKFSDALKLCDPLLEQYPDLVDAHVQQGIALQNTSPERMPEWHAGLPESADEHPDVWILRAGMLSDSPGLAAQCCKQALQLAPVHLVAHLSMAKYLRKMGRTDAANSFAQRAQKLEKINTSIEQIYESPQHLPPIKQVAELCMELGRHWEAANWAGYASSIDRTAAWPREIFAAIKPAENLRPDVPFVFTEQFDKMLASISTALPPLDIARLSRPAAVAGTIGDVAAAGDSKPSIKPPGLQPQSPSSTDQLRLLDVTRAVGVDFTFNSNREDRLEGRRIVEITGGGVAVLDFDNDTWPDLYFAQAGALEDPTRRESDQLFHNRPLSDSAEGASGVDRLFQAVTQSSGIKELGYSQGVAAGDVDGDGFDDVYVCNLGRNTLLLNQGDGTFVDATQLIPEQSNAWTCSAAIVDLDGDGLAEIYDANYVAGSGIRSQLCQIGGLPRGCSPLIFEPAEDRIYTATGSGNFEPATGSVPGQWRGNSLGVSVFALEEERLPSIFVSVDQQANALLRPADTKASFAAGTMKLSEEALVSGLAYDAAGAAQACMGIASGDVNGDGEVDLFVTNFAGEYYTMYIQQSGYFEDATAASGTAAATRPLLGFGCQFADLQLDGHPDLVVLNGHIDDHTHIGQPEEMPAQIFGGLGDGRFRDVTVADVCPRLAEPSLGRGLAKLDFDRDGLTDFVCCDLESPTVLLRGASQPVQTATMIKLVGTTSDRNAFCSRVTLESGEYKRSQQLVAGSGYQVTNERTLCFAVPNDLAELSATVAWPSGKRQTVRGIKPGGWYTIVEE